jgi:hypothetical protein
VGYPWLRRELAARYPWLGVDEVGPASVEAGECDRCGAEARLVEPCGPTGYEALGRGCAAQLSVDGAWCAGHAEHGAWVLQWLGELPDEADDVARLWWVATGEVGLEPGLRQRATAQALPLPDEGA